jgi:hypothetical protein
MFMIQRPNALAFSRMDLVVSMVLNVSLLSLLGVNVIIVFYISELKLKSYITIEFVRLACSMAN